MLDMLNVLINYIINSPVLLLWLSVATLVVGGVLIVLNKKFVNAEHFRFSITLVCLSIAGLMTFSFFTLGFFVATLVVGGVLVVFKRQFLHLYLVWLGMILVGISLPAILIFLAAGFFALSGASFGP